MLSRYTLISTCKISRSLSACRWKQFRTFSNLNQVSAEDVESFARILPVSSIISTLPPSSLSAEELSTYNVDWMNKYRGSSSTVLKPKTTQEVSEILKYCWERRLAVVPQGGNTGLVGGSIPYNNEIIVHMGNMNKVRSFDPVTGMLHLSQIIAILQV